MANSLELPLSVEQKWRQHKEGKHHNLDQKLAIFFSKMPDSIFSFAGYVVSETIQICHCSAKAAIGNTPTNEYGYGPIKLLYGQ